MIVIGYQGIGKSSLSKVNNKYIDLESGNFWVNGKRADDWYIPYCNIAQDLSSQGHVVFTSSHDVVRKCFIENLDRTEKVIVVAPSEELKEQWIEKLKQRYESTGLEKDYKAYMNAVDRYSENICELLSDSKSLDGSIIITDMNYDLERSIEIIEDSFWKHT